jgi:hypothetical protein
VIVRSIKRIKRGEEVTVAYTDLLQPKVVKSLYTSCAVLLLVVKVPIHENDSKLIFLHSIKSCITESNFLV